jgi:hypothetical protein
MNAATSAFFVIGDQQLVLVLELAMRDTKHFPRRCERNAALKRQTSDSDDANKELRHAEELLLKQQRYLRCLLKLQERDRQMVSYEMVHEDEILEILRRIEGSAQACRAVVAMALQHGGKDNVTVLIAQYRIPEHACPDTTGSAGVLSDYLRGM